MTDVRDVMFLANDPLKHDVCWSDVAQGYYLENQEDLVDIFDSLIEALQVMADRVDVSVDQFTIADNPY